MLSYSFHNNSTKHECYKQLPVNFLATIYLHSSSKETQLFCTILEKIVLFLIQGSHFLVTSEGQQEKWITKGCVSFEEECSIY